MVISSVDKPIKLRRWGNKSFTRHISKRQKDEKERKTNNTETIKINVFLPPVLSHFVWSPFTAPSFFYVIAFLVVTIYRRFQTS